MVETTGWSKFKINHSETKNMGIGQCITSPKFRVVQHDWAIMYYPQGSKKDNNGQYVSVYLKLQRENVDVRATIEFALRDIHGTLPLIPIKETSRTFTLHEAIWGFPTFIKRTKLEETFVKDCYFVLHVKITVKDESCRGACSNASSTGSPHGHLQKFREENKRTDVSFDVDGKIFVAHRLILAANSPVFEAELFGSMAESNRDCITISEMLPSVFKALIDFMYNGSLTVDEEHVYHEEPMSWIAFLQHLLAAADLYAVENLKTVCEYKLVKSISLDTVLSNLELAEKHNCTELKKDCLRFIADIDNSISILFSDGYINLMNKHPSLLAELKDLAGK